MLLAYDGFEIDVEGCRLLRAGEAVELEARAFDLLLYLATHPGRLISKRELVAEVWKLRQLSPNVLPNTVGKLRKALAQTARERTPIETVHGRGYRWQAARREAPQHEGRVARAVLPEQAFVGRREALDLVSLLLSQAAQGQGQLVLVSGEAGIGKTRLLREVARRASALGVRVLCGAAHEGAEAPPYWPLVEVLREVRRDLTPAEWALHLPQDSAALRKLAPDLFDVAPAVGSETDPRYARFQLFDQVARLLGSLTDAAPRLILLEDLHCADAGTVELLAHAVHGIGQRRMLVLATLRARSQALNHDLSAALTRLARTAKTVRLRGLSRAEVEQLVAVLDESGHWDARALDVLFERTEGNPLFIGQLVELLAEASQPPEALLLKELGVPSALRTTVRQRVAALGAETRQALEAASVIGVKFDACLLGELLGLPLGEALAALNPALQACLVETLRRGSHDFSFTHALLRDALYEEIDPRTRGLFHEQLMQLLAARGPNEPQVLGRLAYHALAAIPSDLQRCVAHCRRAAEAARASCGYEMAADLWSRLLDKVASEAGDDRLRAQLALELASDRYFTGDFAGALRALESGAELARSLRDGDLMAQFAFRLLDCVEAGADGELTARRAVEDALQVNEAAVETRAVLLAHYAEVAFDQPFEERARLLSEAHALALRSGDSDLLLEVRFSQANLRHPYRLDYNRSAVRGLREILQSPRYRNVTRGRVGLRHVAVEGCDYLCALTSSDLRAADEIAYRARTLAVDLNLPWLRVGVELMAMGRALGDGRLDEVETRLSALHAPCERMTGNLRYAPLYFGLLAAQARGSFAALQGLGPPPTEATSRYALRGSIVVAWCFAHLGREAEAGSVLARVPEAELSRMPVLQGDLGVACLLAELYCLLGREEEAARLYPRLIDHVHFNAVGPCFEYHGAVGHYVGMLCALLGRTAEATRHFEQARNLNQRLGMRLQCARSEALLAGKSSVKSS